MLMSLHELLVPARAQSYCSQVVPLHGAFFREGSISIVLEYMDGGSLADLLHASGSLSERQLLYISQQAQAPTFSAPPPHPPAARPDPP